MGVRLTRGEVRGQSHFPDCLVLRERGEASTSRAFAPTPPPNISAHACASLFSVAIVGDGGEINKRGSQQ